MLPAAPDVVVQIAHLCGAGGVEAVADQALQVFVEAIAKKDPRTSRLWFDVTTSAAARTTAERAELLARRVRELGVQRVLYGSDAPTPTNLPRNGWKYFRALPLTEAEFQTIANNVPPYMK
jgi:predicted TIM-barrel fold metal-dependent hydrolase